MNWQSRLEKTAIALNLIGLALGFGTLGILILVKGEHAGGSLISGILGIVVGSLFLLFAFYFCKHRRGSGDRNAGYTLKDDLKKSELSSLKKVTI
jgi:ABC-type antimicrobial peptide transport system permease subunit